MPRSLPLRGLKRALGAAAAIALAGGLALVAVQPANAATSPCADGSTPALLSTVTCAAAGSYTLAVPAGTTSVDADVVGAGGGAGYPARAHIGGNAAEVTGTLTLPAGTAYLYVVVGTAGTGDNHGTSTGGGGSAVFAEDSGHGLLAKLVIAGGGGGGAYNGDGGNAGSAGTSDNAQTVSGPGQPGIGGAGGAGGTGNYAPGTAGGSNNPATLTVAAGGQGGAVPGGATGGGGAGGYAGGGGGGGSRGSILSSNVAGGGGGSSLASAYLGSAAIAIAQGTGGVQLPGLVASDGATGSVTLTFDGLAVPGAPTGVSGAAGNGQVSVSFQAPASDGGSPVTSYTVTGSPGGRTATCAGSPCVVTGLTNGTAYRFTVHATNANGDSPESSASAAVTPATVPAAPTNASAVAGEGQASVSFTAPASNGGSAVTSYTVTSSPGGRTATCPGGPCVVTGLTNGTAYTFTVHATNAQGDSVESAATSAVTPTSTPDAPTNVSATPGNGAASVSFDAPSSNGSPITGYTVTTSPGGQTATCAGSPCVVSGLTNGTAYTFTVHATNANGDSPESSTTAAVTPASVPGAPTNASAVAGDGQASVSFTAPADDGGSSITGYTVTSSPGGRTATCPGSPCVVSGLTNGTTYTFTVHATNDQGDSIESSATSAVTPSSTPDAPANVSATPGDGRATVSFDAPSSNGSAITSYTVTSAPGGQTATCADSPCVVTGLTNGTAYTFTVHATNANGDSPESDATASVTPAAVPGAPTNASATFSDGQASVSFTAPADDGGSPVTSYTVTSTPGGITATCADSPCVVTGLTDGTAYTFTVHATNGAGDSAESAPTASGTPQAPATAPAAPSDVTYTTTDTALTVTFTAPADGGSPITGYEISLDGGATWATLTTTQTGTTVTGTVTGLRPDTAFRVQVRAVNALGSGDATPTADVATNPTPPAAPTITSPTDGQHLTGKTVTFTGTGTPGADVLVAVVPTADVRVSPSALTRSASPARPFAATPAAVDPADPIVVQPDGTWSATATLAPGDYTAVATSFRTDQDGAPVTDANGDPVVSAPSAPVEFTLAAAAVTPGSGSTTPTGAGTGTNAPALAFTGSDAAPEALIGLLLLLAGLVTFRIGRARRRA